MMTKLSKNVIVDTGCANLSSVKFAVQRLGYAVTITDNVDLIKQADKVIFPGVGSAKHAMANIKAKNLVGVLQQLTQPVLGFCLGMQLMTESSTEGKSCAMTTANDSTIACLNLIPTKIEPLKAQGNRLPHMGWNTLKSVANHPIFNGITEGDYFYFVHSYFVTAENETHIKGRGHYGQDFVAAIGQDNVFAVQFHPEKSHTAGLQLLENFLNWDGQA